ncbi:hypothetical protein NL676_033639 [Syzygium grande]|nr:hypothetical protein NL676_033639 [Syzygium grande]
MEGSGVVATGGFHSASFSLNGHSQSLSRSLTEMDTLPPFSSLNRALPRLVGESWLLRLRWGGPQKLPLSVSAQLL